MFPFKEITEMIIKSLPVVLLSPLFWVVIVLVWFQYRRLSTVEEKVIGSVVNQPHISTFISTLYGIAGGLAGSFLLILVGVSISNIGLGYVWVLAVLMMLVHPRFMCFSYAGGIVSLASLVFGYPKIDVPGLMAIVAILHFIEGILIIISGRQGAAPIFMKDKRFGVVGGFALQKFWPVPIIILITIASQQVPGEMIPMPDWWPLIKPEAGADSKNLIYVMFPVVAGLGYGDMAVSHNPKHKSAISAGYLFVFSSVLLVLSIVASHDYLFKYIAALFAPLAHDVIIHIGRKAETSGIPIYTAPDNGLRVLEVMPDSPARKMGIKSGDVILSINNRALNSKEALREFLNDYPSFIWIEGFDIKGRPFNYEYKDYVNGIGALGTLLVPGPYEDAQTFSEFRGSLLLRWLKGILKALKINGR